MLFTKFKIKFSFCQRNYSAHQCRTCMKPSRIALLTDISQEITPFSTSDEAVFAYELAAAMVRSAKDTGGIAVDVVARKSSTSDLPVVSVDPSGLGEIPGDPLQCFAWQDAVYSQLLMGGMLNGYALVHCLAPVVTPLLMLSANRVPVVQTIITNASHPSVTLPPKLMGNRFRQVFVGPYQVADELAAIPPSVDLSRFQPADKPADNFILYIGKKNEAVDQLATSVNLAVYTLQDGEPEELVKNAAVVLQLAEDELPCRPVWLMRALACGTPVAAWSSDMPGRMFLRQELGVFVEKGNFVALANGIKNLPSRNIAQKTRREYALGMFGQRSQAARYRDIYKSVLLRR